MGRKSYIVLHKSEWDRLHRKKDDSIKLSEQREAYFKKLVDISQAWIKTWPDTVQGHVEQVKKDKEKHHKEEIALVKAFLHEKKKEGTKEALKNAKQLIFEDSCYGKQLLSAFLESKTLEERDRQIELQKELKQQSEAQEKESLSKLKNTFDLGHEEVNKQKKRVEEIEISKLNKSIYEMKLSKAIDKKKKQEVLERENVRLMQELLDLEARQEKEYEKQLRKDVELYEKEQEIARQRKVEREKIAEEVANAQRKELDKRYCKIRQVMKDMHHDRNNTEQYKRNYEIVKKIQETEQARYNEFVEAGIKKLEVRTSKDDHQAILMKNLEKNKRHLISEHNKKEAEKTEQSRLYTKKFNCGHRQSILPKSNYSRMKNTSR
ncbi:cilia- and flagella- associated protein 210-like [Ostrinia nubilalis]|uniref:cilia- and flagella- associated protein 210-like n=1 Tax=Ostrinia nubilalis TaxID=29057 RepID=UPI0030824354